MIRHSDIDGDAMARALSRRSGASIEAARKWVADAFGPHVLGDDATPKAKTSWPPPGEFVEAEQLPLWRGRP